MGRRISVGIVPGGIGQLSVEQNTITSVDINANLTITADGTGIIQIAKNTNVNGNLTMLNQSGVRFRETTANGTNFAQIRAPANLTADYTLTLPSALSSDTNNRFVLHSDTSGNLSWDVPRTFVYSVLTTSFSALPWNGYFINTTSGGITATLPANPSTGDTIRFFDVARTFQNNALTVNRNGQRIQGDLENLTVNTTGAAFELIFSNTTFGWRIFSI
jgi:hypothetical protein